VTSGRGKSRLRLLRLVSDGRLLVPHRGHLPILTLRMLTGQSMIIIVVVVVVV